MHLRKGQKRMAGDQWTRTKPGTVGWHWFRGQAYEADSFIVQVDEAGQFQLPACYLFSMEPQ